MDLLFVEPTSPREAVALLSEHGPESKLLAGGTAVVLQMQQRTLRPAALISLAHVAGLQGMALAENQVTHYQLRHGDVDAAFAASDYVIEETYTSPAAQHVTMEPHVSLAQFAEGQLTVYTASQAPYAVRKTLAEIFGLPPSQVRVFVGPLGGGYGGKGHIWLEPLVAALAWKTGGRPVKLVATRAEEFVIVTKHAATISIKTGVMRDGTLMAREVTSWWNVGAYADASWMLTRGGMLRSIGPYRIGAVRADSYGIYTNRQPPPSVARWPRKAPGPTRAI
jgi:CO/xanthine dehydrogenase Mo-binding subunit